MVTHFSLPTDMRLATIAASEQRLKKRRFIQMYICTYYKVIIQFPQIAKNTEPVRNRVFSVYSSGCGHHYRHNLETLCLRFINITGYPEMLYLIEWHLQE